MIIRKAVDRDFQTISRIYNEIRKSQFPWIASASISDDDFRKDSAGEEIQIAEMDGLIVGFVSAWKVEGFIHHLFVEPKLQGTGVGARLMDFAERIYPSPLRLKCGAENKRGIDFYQRRGWVILESGTSEDGKYYLMEFGKPSKAAHATKAIAPR
jgi:GNAT superfamily N-acetyltransferase